MIIKVFVNSINNKMDDANIRDQIIITDNCNEYDLRNYSNIELATKYSKNKNNLEILEKLLLNVDDKNIINELLITTLKNIELTVSFDGLKLLIKYGGNVNHFNSLNSSPLVFCCMHPNAGNLSAFLRKIYIKLYFLILFIQKIFLLNLSFFRK